MSNKQVNKQTAAKLKTARAVLSVWTAHTDTILPQLPFPNAQSADVTRAFISAVLAVVGASSADLEAKDLAVGIERQDDDPERKARDAATRNLSGLITRTRPTLEAVLGAEASTRYGLAGQTPEQPDQLAEFGGRVVGLLASDPATFTDMFGHTIETSKVAAMLRPAVQTLRDALAGVRREQSELDQALIARDAEAARLDRMTRAVSLVLEGVFMLADQEALFLKAAGRLRPVAGAGDAAATPEAPTDTPEPTEPS